jgi:uncharacterized repeat protein (TIGR03803 family)
MVPACPSSAYYPLPSLLDMDTPTPKKNARNRIVFHFNGFTCCLPAFRRFVCLLGFSTGLALSAEGQVTLPYATDFDATFGFSPGPLNGQHSWIVLSGSADITTTVSDLGTQSVVLKAGSPAAMIGVPFAAPSPAQPVIYVDCLMKPVASASVSSLIYLDTSLVVLVNNGSQGQIFTYDGTSWIPTSAVFPLNSDGTSLDWMRLTFRLDFTAKTWDLYFDETLAAQGVAFIDKGAAYLPFFILQGDPTSPSYLNYLSVGAVNPLAAAAPVFSPAPGTYASAQTVTVASATSGAIIRCTTDGSTPTETNGTVYSGPISINRTTMLKAIAYVSGIASDSPVTSGFYAITNAPAISLNVIYNFTGSGTGGIHPDTNLLQGSDGNFYGTTGTGGFGLGNVFKVTPAGALTTVASFNGSTGTYPNYENLVQDGSGNIYGTTENGGGSNYGTVFKLTPAGVLSSLASFTGTYESGSQGLVKGSDDNFYGTTEFEGNANDGTVFKVTPAGILTTLVSFNSATGIYPNGRLVQGSDGNFYGTTYGVYNQPAGTVFKVTPAGVLTTLVAFNGANGAKPSAGLVQGSDGNFYGTTQYGGSTYSSSPYNPGYGTIFRMTPAGVLTTLFSFTGPNGAAPAASMIVGSDGNFYGTTSGGGSTYGTNGGTGFGTAFMMTPTGILTTLASFTGPNGSEPYGSLTQGGDGNFYGTAEFGGIANDGVIFQLIPAPAQ